MADLSIPWYKGNGGRRIVGWIIFCCETKEVTWLKEMDL